MSSDEREQEIEKINKMTQVEMARLWRFAPVGHKYYTDEKLFRVFEKRFKQLGGFTVEISKEIGWENSGHPIPSS